VNRRIVNAWCMYDWANSAFITTVVSALFPPFFRSLVTARGLPENTATAYWGYTSSAALLVMAFLAPLLGAISDHTGGKKRYVAVLATLGAVFTASFVFIGSGAWPLAALLYILAVIGFSGGDIFYESLLPSVAGRGDLDRVSSRGYALGYVGGGTLLALNALWVMKPHVFGMPDVAFATRASFLSVAVWWAVFSIPFFRLVPEPPRSGVRGGGRAVAEGFARLGATFREVKRYRQLFLFLVAFWIYTDGIGTIVRMATAYGDEIGIGIAHMVAALVVTQFVAIPFTFLFGALAGRIGAKRSVFVALLIYGVVSVGAYFMRTAFHFYLLAFLVGTAQGGAQALSRSLFARMVPRDKAAEFFGFFGSTSRFAGIAGPLLFGLVSELAGGSRTSILLVVAFFVVGGALLARVDVDAGVRAVEERA
jgi:UMF1 family MFS transporter